MVVLCDPDPAAEDVPGLLAILHGEGPGVDDVNPPVGRKVWSLPEALDAVVPLGDVVGLLWHHGELVDRPSA